MRCAEKLLNLIKRVANGEYERDNWRGILDSVAELFEADAAAIGEVREGYVYYTKVSSVLAKHEDYSPEKFKVPIWRSAFKEALRRGFVVVNDYQSYEMAVEAWRKSGLRSVLIAVLGDREPFGSLAVGRVSTDKPFTEEDGRVLRSLAFIFSFIVREELEKKRLMEMTIRDHLTKLYNRLYFKDEGRKEVERARRYRYPISLIMFDLDDFKKVNDSFGHQRGDEVLIRFARILKKNVRSTDMPVRFGGEEFVVLLPHTDLEEALRVAERVRERFSKVVFRFDSQTVRLTVSAGVAACESQECDLEGLLYRADKALYRAKVEGKNRTVLFSRTGIN